MSWLKYLARHPGWKRAKILSDRLTGVSQVSRYLGNEQKSCQAELMITREVRTPLAQALFGEKLVPEATKNYIISCTSFKSVFGPSVGVQDG